jgi:Reverse transcriptase (RNA-dependent DNA polymerase)/gag-polypeptide of LTR copia-type/GAG-pre-integrase domain
MAESHLAYRRSDQPIQFTHQINTILSPDNYLLWKSQIIPVLRGHGLMSFIADPSPVPEAMLISTDGVALANPEFERWQQQDQLLLAWLFNSLSPQILAQVLNCETASQLWHKLLQIYNSQSLAKILELKLKIQTIKKGGDTCSQYLQKFQAIADQLRSIGSDMTEQDLILFTLQGLGTEYENFVTAISMRSGHVTLPELQSLLLSHEARLLSTQQHTSLSQNVNLTTHPSTHSGGGFLTTPINGAQSVSHTSQPPGRFFPTSNKRNTFRGRGRGRTFIQPKDDARCQICQRLGHTALKCYHRFDISYTSTSISSSQSNQALVAEPASPSPSQAWFLDSGATAHVTPDINCLISPQPYTGSDKVFIGNGSGLCISHTGTSSLITSDGSLHLKNVLCVPQLTKNLLSISKLLQDNTVTVEFTSISCFVKDQHTQRILLHGTLCNGLYKLDSCCSSHQVMQLTSSADIWHSRLAHCSYPIINALSKHNHITMSKSQFSSCRNCNKAKAHKLSFVDSTTRATKPLQVIHTDLWGPSPIVSQTGNKYYILFTDDFSRFSWIYFCSSKSDVVSIFAQFKQKVEMLLSHKICVVQCDGGTEYKPLQSQFPEITFHISCPYTPEQNGLIERKHRHVVELSLASMYHASIPLEYWDTIFESTLFVINRLPTVSNYSVSPFEKLFHQVPEYQYLHTLGCECFPLLRPYNQHKLQPRSESCVFMGYSALHKGYKCLHLPTQRLYISRHVKFNEIYFPFAHITPNSSTLSGSHNSTPLTILPFYPLPSPSPLSPLTESSAPSTHHSPTAVQTSLPAHSMVTRSQTNSLRPKRFPHHQLYTTTKALTSSSDIEVEPSCYTQAVKSAQWRQAMACELDALAQNGTWQLVDPPSDGNVIGCKWLFRIKRKADGTVDRYKARLVAKGYTQEEGLDYFETFSPVVKPTTIRAVLTIAIASDWTIHQLDVNNAFLHGDLEETIYMYQPPGFVDQLYPHKVCQLKKALYGLKQAPRAWFHKLKSFLLSQKFICSQSDNSLFIFRADNIILYLLVYVDDIILTGNNNSAVQSLITTFNSAFSLKDLGTLHFFWV